MTNFKSWTIWTITLNFFILIGAGHGLACIGLIELAGLFYGYRLGENPLSFSLTNSYEKSMGVSALFSLIGQIFLLLSLLLKKYNTIFWTRIIGLVLLWVGFYYLTHNFSDDPASQLGFFTGLPFMIMSIRLVYQTYKLHRQTPKVDNE
jgi:hypothetical protein